MGDTACAILALFPITIPHHGQSQVSLKNNGDSIHEISFCPPIGMMTSRFFTIVVDMSCMADVPPMLPFWLHWYLTAFRFQVKGIPLLLQEQNLRLQPFIFSERLGQSRPTGGKAKQDRGARIQLSGYILGCSQCLTSSLRRSARISYNLF